MAAGRFTREELEAFRGATVDDVLPPTLRLLFVGINPGLWTAAANAHFARPGNRFWPALFAAGITSRPFDVSAGMQPADRAELDRAGIGITNLVGHATVRADELSADDLATGGERLKRLLRDLRPEVVAVLGVTAFRQAFDARKTSLGCQPERFEGVELWVLPNPSGLNAHETVASLADWYRQAAVAAGVVP